jgi:hypothetical protein
MFCNPRLFLVSSHSNKASVVELLDQIEIVCQEIFATHTKQIPRSFSRLLNVVKYIPTYGPYHPIQNDRKCMGE